MKYSLAIIALLGLTNAIQIREEPAAAAPAPAAADAPKAEAAATAVKVAAKATDEAAEKAAEPEKPKTKAKGLVADALKTPDEESQEAVNHAGQKIDTSNAPEAIPQPKVDEKEKPIPLSEGEKTRNAVIRNATVGQEAIANNNNSVEEVTKKYADKAAK